MKLSLVIPVYNAEKIIISSVRSLIETLAPLSLPYEILLRDDKSTDGSVEVLKSLPGMDPRVRCFFNPANQGLGATLRELFRDARGEIVIYCDVDLPFGAAEPHEHAEHHRASDEARFLELRGSHPCRLARLDDDHR